MEGISGVVNWNQTEYGKEDYERFRKLMTQEANAAIEGAFEAGTHEVLVNDRRAELVSFPASCLSMESSPWPSPVCPTLSKQPQSVSRSSVSKDASSRLSVSQKKVLWCFPLSKRRCLWSARRSLLIPSAPASIFRAGIRLEPGKSFASLTSPRRFGNSFKVTPNGSTVVHSLRPLCA